MTQDKSETYSQFSTRLMSLFDYYVESRKVSQSYDKLIDLIVYDRVKSIPLTFFDPITSFAARGY